MLRTVKELHQPSRKIRRGSLSPGGIAEKPERCQGLSFDPLHPEDLQHLLGEGLHVCGTALLQKKHGQLQAHEPIVKGQLASPEHSPYLFESG